MEIHKNTKKWKKNILKICKECNTEFYIYPSREKRWQWLYCSRSCAGKNTIHKNNKISNKCIICDKLYIVKWYRNNITKCCSNKCRQIYTWLCIKWNKNYNWKWWISNRSSNDKKWSLLVKIRDNYICKECWCDKKILLQSHHIVWHSIDKEKRNNIDNWITLCRKCHSDKHPHEKQLILKERILNWIKRNCNICNNEYYIPRYKENTSKYCSHECKMFYLNNFRHYGKKEMDTRNKYESLSVTKTT